MSTYPADGSEFERGAWALCTGIDAALVIFGSIAFCIVAAQLVIEGISTLKSKRKP